MSLIRSLLLLVVLGLCSAPAMARHIVGGEVTYQCVGQPDANSRTYRVQVTIYRDDLRNGADFDSAPGGSGTFELSIFDGRDLLRVVEVRNDQLEIEELEVIEPDPCVVYPPAIRTERGVYTFEVTLPISNRSYTISYQRCCRNNIIANIVSPGEAGATYSVDIPPLAQQSCNSSPVFNQLAPLLICRNRLLEFDHSATDPDGDQLVYSLCDPYYGGGDITSGADVNSFNGVMPNPESPPPYTPVVFQAPFSNTRPLDSRPPMSIDALTGLLTVNPQNEGVYVVCLSVSEYRNGELLSTVRRDFQFTITDCDPLVKGNVLTNATADSLDFGLLLFCGTKEVELINTSTDRAFIEDIRWELDGTTSGTFSSGDEVIQTTYPDYGDYPVRLLVNPSLQCNDTLDFIVRLTPPGTPEFSYTYDTCVYGPVEFTNLSSTESDSIVFFQWDFGNSERSTEKDPVITYQQGGRRDVELSFRDNFGCVYSRSQEIQYFPVPAELSVDIGGDLDCAPTNATFRQSSSLLTDDYEVFWDFGDGTTSDQLNPDYQYQTPGEYIIYVSALSPFGCFVDTQLRQPLRILEAPRSTFTFAPQQIDIRNPRVDFFDQSFAPVSWQWDFGGLDESRETDPFYVFPDTGSYAIDLIVSHLNGCRDTSTQFLRIADFTSYHLPNAFTPDGNGLNEGFRGIGFTNLIENFSMEIFNRWGERVFLTDDIEEAWDGTTARTGGLAQEGVYLYVVEYDDPDGPKQLRGYVTLLR